MLDPDYRRFVERVKQAASIEEVVMARVPGMRQAGALYKACCPFHDERTPSFVVTPARGTWHCFGACGEGGDVIRFLEKLDGLTFREAVEELARQHGIEIPRSSRVGRERSAREVAALEALERAQRLYQRRLLSPQAAEAQRYLAGRDLRPATLEVFGVGFAPGGNALVSAAREAGFSEQALLDAGLARRRDDGRLQDFFYARITIPIRAADGQTLGFGARLLPGVEGPKYVNSPDSPLFHKGRLIFGLDQAREAVRREKRILLMEGYTDVMACHQVGLRTAVAVLGTATTEEHGKLVRRSGAKQATLVFDGDAAGRKAVSRALQGLLTIEGLRIDVALPPEGLDPADVCQKDPDALRRALERPTPWFDFLLEGIAALERDQRPAAVRELLALLKRLPSPVERENLLAEASARLGWSKQALLAEGQRLERGPGEPRGTTAARAQTGAQSDAQAAQGGRSPRAGLRRGGEARPSPREARAWGELLAALLQDNALIEVRRSEIRLAFEGPVFEPPSSPLPAAPGAMGEPGAPTPLAPGAPAARSGPQPAPPAPEPGPASRPPPPDPEGRWGAPDPRLRLLFRTLLELYDDPSYADRPLDAGVLLGAVEDPQARALLSRLDGENRFAESPRALADQVLWTLGRVWSRRRDALLLTRPPGAAGQESEEELLKRFNQVLLERRQRLGPAAAANAPGPAPSPAAWGPPSSAAPAPASAAAVPPRPTQSRPQGPHRTPKPSEPESAQAGPEGLDWGDLGPL